MTPKEFFLTYEREQIEKIAIEAGTTFHNFRQIALYSGPVSSRLAKRLEEASGGVMGLREILFPEEFEGMRKELLCQ